MELYFARYDIKSNIQTATGIWLCMGAESAAQGHVTSCGEAGEAGLAVIVDFNESQLKMDETAG